MSATAGHSAGKIRRRRCSKPHVIGAAIIPRPTTWPNGGIMVLRHSRRGIMTLSLVADRKLNPAHPDPQGKIPHAQTVKSLIHCPRVSSHGYTWPRACTAIGAYSHL